MKPFKFVIQAVLVETDEDGKITAEFHSEPTTLYGEALVDVAARYDEMMQAGIDAQSAE